MSFPSKTTLSGMSFSQDGTPFVQVASKSGQDPNGLSWSQDGTPFYFTPETAAPTGTNVQINIGGSWKAVESMQINIGGSWKAVSNASLDISSAWKTIY